MNYLPFCGYWFYGAADAEETASYFSSYGLLADAPAPSTGVTILGGLGRLGLSLLME